ncbi:hypothetical protein COHA_004183 [Chlorella ohadii]|uniref:Uncharacterized protein n=1 Tax=Chlorella ohadii TaxID=2649997 RepID=A0AAD5DU68_9CHLO|nr:hypothetical protein COHA_004183 [Chlorella ohadii]
MVAKLWLDQTPPVTGPFALARHAMLLLFSSGAVTFVLLQAEVMRLSFAVPVQLVVALNCAGLVLPLLVHAALESSLFREHQRQRRQHGMPLECGLMQRLYDSISGLREALDGVMLAVALWMLLGLLWKLAMAVAFYQTDGS